MTDIDPVLSICVPCYNSGHFLRVMLQALLPQVSRTLGKVELWILDNASTDDTRDAVEQSQPLGPLQYIINETNLGATQNYINGCCKFARGKYVWILGHHNLMAPDALSYVLNALESHADLEVFYTNFRCATFPDQWPQTSHGGYDGAFQYLANENTDDKHVREWCDLIDARSAMCTQVYAHIVRRDIWVEYWANKRLGKPFQDALTTYPHTTMLVDTVFKKPSLYLGTPTITIFNGAQSWGDLDTQLLVYLQGFPDLLKNFARGGLSSSSIRDCKVNFGIPQATRVLQRAINRDGVRSVFQRVLRISCVGSYIWKSLWLAFFSPEYNSLSRCITRFRQSFQNRRNSWIYNCRPVRWYRSRLQRKPKE